MKLSWTNTAKKKLPEGVELLEIPGAGDPISFFKQLMEQKAPLQTTPAAQGVAGLGANEQTVQSLLAKFLGGSATEGEAYKAGMGEIQKTLGGEFYDPRTSDFWSGFREQSAMEQEEGTAALRRRGQLGGGLFSTGVASEERKYQTAKEAERTTMLGGLYEKERDRKTSAVGQALGYAEFGEAGAANRINLGATVGAIPRDIQNQQYTAAFNQAQQKSQNKYAQELFPFTAQAGIAQNLMPQWLMGDNGELDIEKMKTQITDIMRGMGGK